MSNTTISCALAASLAVLGLSLTSASALTLQLTDTVSGPITITDDGADDLDSTTGELLYDSNLAASTLSGAFSLLEVSATSKPVIGAPGLAELALEVEADSDFNAETVTVAISDTDFNLDSTLPWSGIHALGGFTAGSVMIEAFFDPSNTLFGTANSIGGPFAFNSTVDPFEAFSATLFDEDVGSSPFSMTTILTITHASGDELTEVTSGAALAPVPVPAALPLLLGAIGAVGLLGRRQRKATET